MTYYQKDQRDARAIHAMQSALQFFLKETQEVQHRVTIINSCLFAFTLFMNHQDNRFVCNLKMTTMLQMLCQQWWWKEFFWYEKRTKLTKKTFTKIVIKKIACYTEKEREREKEDFDMKIFHRHEKIMQKKNVLHFMVHWNQMAELWKPFAKEECSILSHYRLSSLKVLVHSIVK